MATQFQNRLVGTVILVSLGVIFLPDLLTGKGDGGQEPIASVPLRPEAQPAKPEVVLPADTAAVLPAASPAVSTAVSTAATEQWTVDEPADTLTLGAGAQGANQVVAANQVVPASTSNQPPVATQAPVPTQAPVSTQAPAQVDVAAVAEQPKPPAKTEAAPPAAKPFEPQVKPFVPEIKPFVAVAGAKPAVPSKPGQPAFKSSAWVIQVGVFSNTANAQALAARLRAAGIPASVRSWSSGGSRLNRVMVGPDVAKSKLDGMLSRVNQIGGTAGKVVAYNPLD